MNRSLQELIDIHHSEAGSMNMDYAIEHVQIYSADHPADPNQDDQFIPHEEQVWELDQHEQSEHPEQRDI